MNMLIFRCAVQKIHHIHWTDTTASFTSVFCLMKRESRFYSSNTVGFTVVCGLAGSLLSSPEELIKKSKFIYYQCIYEVFSIFLCF